MYWSTLDINTRAITITADAKSKVYGAADPALTYQITSGSLVGSDTFSGLDDAEATFSLSQVIELWV